MNLFSSNTSLFLILIITIFCGEVNATVSGNIVVVTNRGDLLDNGSYARWIKAFKNRYPAVDDVTIKRSDNYEVESVAMFQLRDYGDVTLVPENLPKDLYPNCFVALDDLEVSEFVYFKDAWAFDGSKYAFTQGVSVEGLVYNKALFKRFDITAPKTTSELFEVAQTLKSNGITPLAMNVGAAWPLQQWDKAPVAIARDPNYYETLLSMDEPFSATSPYGKSFAIAHRFFKEGWVEDNIIENGWDKSKQSFNQGNTAMYFLGSWVIPQLIDLGVDSNDIGFVPFPFTDVNQQVGLVNKDWGIAVSKYSQNPDTAKAWIQFLFTQTDYADIAGFIPTDKRRKTHLSQMQEFQNTNPELVQAMSPSHEFIRVTNMAGIDFMRGAYIRDILFSTDLGRALNAWNVRWQLAVLNYRKQEQKTELK